MTQPKTPLRMAVTGLVLVVAAIAAYALYKRYVEYPWTRDGQVRANVILVAPRVAGWVSTVAVTDNQPIEKGDLLFEIDPTSFELSVVSARVQLDQAREQVGSLEAAVVVQEASVEQARPGIATAEGQIDAARAEVGSAEDAVGSSRAGLDIAQATIDRREADHTKDISERDRAVKLAAEGAGSVKRAESETAAALSSKAQVASAYASKVQAESDLSQSESGLVQAQANLRVVENGLPQAQAGLVTALANLRQAQANLGVPGEENVNVRAAKAALAEAELDLEWTRVLAPASGFVTNLTLDEGHYSQVGSSAMALVDRSTFWVSGYFQETDLGRIAVGDPVVVTLMSHPDHEIEGEVESFGWAIDPPDIGDAGTSGDVGLVPSVEPSFDWIRLAQRVPVRVKIMQVPEGVQLIAGTTASVAVRPRD
jgi:multidrug resistance efflux pump